MITRITTHLQTPEGWKAELAMMADPYIQIIGLFRVAAKDWICTYMIYTITVRSIILHHTKQIRQIVRQAYYKRCCINGR